MLMIQISAAHGPDECQIAAKLLLPVFLRAAQDSGLEVEVVELNESKNGLLSAIVGLKGENGQIFLNSWAGTIQWTCKSPIRPLHERKNWFVGISVLDSIQEIPEESAILFKACSASGPGGQHVNKTQSAVHATHVATGISVKIQTERSQYANKKLARELIAVKLAELKKQQTNSVKKNANKEHWSVQRGSPIRIFKGLKFEEVT